MIRPYTQQDRADLLKLFQLNSPKYFAPEEQKDLEHYLDYEIDTYYVYEFAGKIVGAGGYNIRPTDGRLSWYFVHPDHQGKGIGKALVQEALSCLKASHPPKIMVRTSQLAAHFFGKFGFVLQKVEPDYWAKGLDLHEMKYVP